MADLQLIIDVIGQEDMVKAVSTAEKFERQFKKLARAQNNGLISAQQYAKGVNQVERSIESAIQDHQRLGQVIQQSSVAVAKAGTQYQRSARGVNRFGVLAQQSGYQIGDFIVQVQSGTNAFVAFGQQATQVAGTLTLLGGRWIGIGTVLGITIPLFTAVGAAIARTREESTRLSFDFVRLGKDLQEAIQPFVPVFNAIGEAISTVGSFIVDALNLVINNLGRLLSIATALGTYMAAGWAAGMIRAAATTASLSAALGALRVAIARTGFGVIVIAAGELIFQFGKLVQAVGGFGKALGLLKDVAVGVWQNIGDAMGLIPLAMSAAAQSMKVTFLTALSDMLRGLQDFVNTAVEALNNTFNLNLSYMNSSLISGVGTGSLDRAISSATIELTRRQNALNAATESLVANIPALQELIDLMNSVGTSDIDIRDYFSRVPKDGEDGGAAGSGDSALEKLLLEIERRKELLRLSGQERRLKEQVFEITDRLGDEANALTATQLENLAKITLELEKQEGLREKWLEGIQSISDSMSDSIGNAFTSMVEGTKSFSQAIRDMAREVIKQLFEVLVVQQLVGSFNVNTGQGSGIVGSIMGAFVNEKGNVYNNGSQVTAFANGGVVGSPTFFPMANGGVGLMGEAGPEAIMPLKRGKGGRLGVEVSGEQGNVTINQTFAFSANGDDSVKKIIAQEAPKIAALTQKQMLDARRRGGVVRDTFA